MTGGPGYDKGFPWRRGDPFPDADEDICFISRYLLKYLDEPPLIANVEDNSEPSATPHPRWPARSPRQHLPLVVWSPLDV